MAAIAACREAGLFPSANTNFNRVNQAELEQLYELLRERGVKSWQVQLTAPLGRAADRPEMILQPFDLVELVPRIAQLKERGHREGLLIMPGNNLGYFGPEEALLRSSDPRGKDHFQGCQAGRFLMGIESQGDVKGCPSLQSAHYVGGNLRERPLNDIWDHSQQLAFRRHTADIELWGFCASCPFSRTCRGGCTFTAHSLLGRPGNNPLCHFRARDFQRRGLRERLIPVEVPPGTPFDNGRFDIVLEPWDAPDPPPPSVETLLMPRRKPRRKPSVSQPR
jgi:radical SAM protein with 4Fe4S-binding SPASM domain